MLAALALRLRTPAGVAALVVLLALLFTAAGWHLHAALRGAPRSPVAPRRARKGPPR